MNLDYIGSISEIMPKYEFGSTLEIAFKTEFEFESGKLR